MNLLSCLKSSQKSALSLFFLSLLFLNIFSHAAELKNAPDVPIKLLQASRNELKSLKDLKGKVILLDLWATWCEPCVDSIPHMNKLAQAFKDRPVQIISVTEEDKAIVNKFLEKHSMSGWIGYEAKNLFLKFGRPGMPQTFIIDKKGRIAGSYYPNNISTTIVEDALAGLPLKQEEMSIDEGGLALAEIRISSASGPSLYETSDHHFKASNTSLKSALSIVCEVKEGLVDIPQELNVKYNFVVSSLDWNSLCAPFISTIEVVLRLEIKKDLQKRDVYYAEGSGGGPELKEAGLSDEIKISSSPNSFKVVKVHPSILIKMLEQALGTAVYNRTDLKGRYSLSLSWDEKKPEAIPALIEKATGLKLRRAREKVDVIVVKKAS